MATDTAQVNALKGQALKQLRKSRGWTQEEMGKKLGSTRRETVLRWESGEWPDAVTARALASVFGLDAAYFDNAARGVLAHETKSTDSEVPAPVAQLHQLFTMDPRHPTGPWTLQEVQDHLARQIEFFFRQAMPDGQVTVEGVKRARALLSPKKPKARK